MIICVMSCLLLDTWLSLSGQQSNTFYLMHQVPESNLLNPAVQAACRWHVGIPALASVHLSYGNTAFTYNDLAGTDTWNLEGTASQMHRRDLYIAEAAIQLISIGYRHRLNYFTFRVSEKSQVYSVVPGDLVSLAVFGNGPSVGETLRVRSLRPSGFYQREYAAGISRVLGRRLTAGVRARMVFGKASFYPGSSNLFFHTEESTFNLLLEGDYTLNSSFPLTITQDPDGNITGISLEDLNYTELLLNRGNPGIGLDLGIIYRLDQKITLSASLLDLGFVRWRTDLNTLRTEGSFYFRGVDAGTDVVSFGYLEELIDSIRSAFTEEVLHQPYVSYTPVQFFLAGTYRLREKVTLGVVNRNVLLRSKLHTSFTVSVQTALAGRILATGSWSYLNNSVANLGAGIAYFGPGIQFHLVTDNLLGIFFPFDSRTLNLRAGISLMLGCPRDKKKSPENEVYGRAPDPSFCGFKEKPKQEERKLRRAAKRLNRKQAGKL